MMSIGNPLPGAGMDDRFQTVRRKLTDLNYRETFGVE